MPSRTPMPLKKRLAALLSTVNQHRYREHQVARMGHVGRPWACPKSSITWSAFSHRWV